MYDNDGPCLQFILNSCHCTLPQRLEQYCHMYNFKLVNSPVGFITHFSISWKKTLWFLSMTPLKGDCQFHRDDKKHIRSFTEETQSCNVTSTFLDHLPQFIFLPDVFFNNPRSLIF